MLVSMHIYIYILYKYDSDLIVFFPRVLWITCERPEPLDETIPAWETINFEVPILKLVLWLIRFAQNE